MIGRIVAARNPEKSEQRPDDLDPSPFVSLTEIFDIFAKYMRRGVSDLIERGDFPESYQELIGFSVWDRDEVERWIADHPDVVHHLLVLTP
jgi:predicted DNA-binding transcriptional regulator AlpA